MRNSQTGKAYGVCRELGSDGNLVEGTFKDGLYHGLLRGTSGDQVVVSLHRDG